MVSSSLGRELPYDQRSHGGSGAKAARHDRPPGGARSGGFAGADRDELNGAPSKEIGEIGGRPSANLDRASTDATRGRSAGRSRLGPRDQVRWLSHACPHRWRRRPIADPLRPRLEPPLSSDRRGASRSQRAERIYRRRAGCSSPRRGDIVQPTASRDGRRSHRRTHLLRLRPSLPERRKHRWLTADRTQGTSGTAVYDRRAGAPV